MSAEIDMFPIYMRVRLTCLCLIRRCSLSATLTHLVSCWAVKCWDTSEVTWLQGEEVPAAHTTECQGRQPSKTDDSFSPDLIFVTFNMLQVKSPQHAADREARNGKIEELQMNLGEVSHWQAVAFLHLAKMTLLNSNALKIQCRDQWIAVTIPTT